MTAVVHIICNDNTYCISLMNRVTVCIIITKAHNEILCSTLPTSSNSHHRKGICTGLE